MTDGPEWFAPKRFGLGAGLPIAWQGWVATGLFIGAVTAAGLLLRHHVPAFVSVIVTASVLFTVLAARTTKGGWHWRWGEKK